MRDVPVLRVLPISQVEGARRTFDWALQTQKVHAGMCREAKQAMDEGIDLKIGDIHVCLLCGYTIEGDLPDNCPICNAKRERFESLPSRRTDLNRNREERG